MALHAFMSCTKTGGMSVCLMRFRHEREIRENCHLAFQSAITSMVFTTHYTHNLDQEFLV